MSEAIDLSPEEIVNRFLGAIETADRTSLEAIYTDDATIWQNFTKAAQPRAANIEMLLRVSMAASLKYVRTELQALGERVFLRHVLTITTRAGQVLEIPTAMFITLKSGRISQIFEYVDSTQFMVPGVIETLAPPAKNLEHMAGDRSSRST